MDSRYQSTVVTDSKTWKPCRRTFVQAALAACALPFVKDARADEEPKPGEPTGPPEGFYSLMPGVGMSGWQASLGNPLVTTRMGVLRRRRFQRLADADMRVHWAVKNDVLECDGAGKNIASIEHFRDFELYLDWKIEKGGQSAVYLRGCPQVQIWDAESDDLGADIGSGGLHNNRTHASKPSEKADKPTGEWNTFFIRMVGEKVTVKLNEKVVVDEVVLENYWERGRPVYTLGPIELKAHGSKVSFRNIYVRHLPCP
jgi:hypothetical protein